MNKATPATNRVPHLRRGLIAPKVGHRATARPFCLFELYRPRNFAITRRSRFASGPVAKAALAFSPAEYFALAILGLTVVSVAALGSTIKGLAMGALGIAISLIGIDSILGSERYTFGFVYLLDGISFVPVMVGLFAITELTSYRFAGAKIPKLCASK